jgi:hypothetical protein
VVFLLAVGVIFAPVLHRILHKLHLQASAPDIPDGDADSASTDDDGTPAGSDPKPGRAAAT